VVGEIVGIFCSHRVDTRDSIMSGSKRPWPVCPSAMTENDMVVGTLRIRMRHVPVTFSTSLGQDVCGKFPGNCYPPFKLPSLGSH